MRASSLLTTAASSRLQTLLFALAIMLGLAVPAQAQFGSPGGLDFTTEQPEVEASVQARYSSVPQGGILPVAVTLTHRNGFHTWPVEGHADLGPDFDFAVRTEIDLASGSPEWATVQGKLQLPELYEATVADPTGAQATVTRPTYHETAVFYLPISIAKDAPLGEQTLTIALVYQACDETQCLAPEFPEFEITFTVLEAGQAPVEASDIGSTFDGMGDFQFPEPETLTRGEGTPPATDRSLFGFNIGSGLLALFLASFIGGALLNLMPCVLPVIPIKIMTLSQHAQSDRKRTFMLGLWMALGVAAFWIGVGIPVAATANSIDPSTVFSYWPVTLGMGVVIILMAFGIMGMFTISLPKSTYMINPKADSPSGSFLFGIMTAVLGLPCFGPIVGGLLAGGTALPASTVMIVFVGLGVGMAAPYLILSANPALVKKVPQTGPAGELVKKSMGFLMLAAGAFFATTGVKTLLKNKPYLGTDIEWLVALLLIIAAGVIVLVGARKAAKSVPGKGVVALIGLGIITLAVWGINDFASTARHEYEERERILAEAPSGEAGAVSGIWLEFSEARLNDALGQGKAVFVDFTADWCVTCRAFKKSVLEPEPVYSRLRQDDVVILEADFDRPEVKRFLKEQVGKTGIPAWVIYGPDLEAPQTVDSFTKDELQRLLDEAGGEGSGDGPVAAR